MTAEKQRRVLTLFESKLSDATEIHEGPAFLTSPCHAWILPEDDVQQVPQLRVPTQDQQRVAPSAEQRVGITPEIPSLQDLRRMSNTPPIMNAPNPTTKRALKSTKRVHRRITCRSTNHAGNPETPNPTRYRGHAGKTISPTGQDCPTHPGRTAPKANPQGQVCPHCRTFMKPQHNQSAGNNFSCRQGMEQLATALHPNKPPTEGRTYRC